MKLTGIQRTVLRSQSGMIHVFAMLAVVAVMIITYVKVQGYVDETLAARRVEYQENSKKEMLREPLDVSMRVSGEKFRVLGALGLVPTKEDISARIAKMTPEEQTAAKEKIGQIIDQPPTIKLEDMLELAYGRWDAVKDYVQAKKAAK